MFEDDDADEEQRMKMMLEKQTNISSEENSIRMSIPAPQKQRRMSKMQKFESFDDDE